MDVAVPLAQLRPGTVVARVSVTLWTAAPGTLAETITGVVASNACVAGGVYMTTVPDVALSVPGPLSVQVGVSVLPLTTALRVTAAPPGACAVVAEGVTTMEL